MHRVHKWLAVLVGAFLVLWLASAVVMTLPLSPSQRPPREGPLEPGDLDQAKLTPAEAVAVAAPGGSTPVTSITLRRLGSDLVYEVAADPDPVLVDARSGQIVRITPGLAESLARRAARSQGGAARVTEVTAYELAYPGGPLPAYRVSFEPDHGTVFYVSASDGSVRRSDRWSRAQVAAEYLHTFGPLGGVVREALLVLLSVVGIFAAGTGYYLALKYRRAWRGRKAPEGRAA